MPLTFLPASKPSGLLPMQISFASEGKGTRKEGKGTRNFLESLYIIILSNHNHSSSSSGGEQTNELLCSHTVEYYTALNMDKPDLHHS